MEAIPICMRWIKNLSELSPPLTRLQRTLVEWKWGLITEVSFRILENKYANITSMFSINEDLPVQAYFDASPFARGFDIMYRVKGIERPIVYDSSSCTTTQRKYGTYKSELFMIVTFAEKYKHHFTTCHTEVSALIMFLSSPSSTLIGMKKYARGGQFSSRSSTGC